MYFCSKTQTLCVTAIIVLGFKDSEHLTVAMLVDASMYKAWQWFN